MKNTGSNLAGWLAGGVGDMKLGDCFNTASLVNTAVESGECSGSFQCRGVLLIWDVDEQEPAVLGVGVGGGFGVFLSSIISLFSPFFWKLVR